MEVIVSGELRTTATWCLRRCVVDAKLRWSRGRGGGHHEGVAVAPTPTEPCGASHGRSCWCSQHEGRSRCFGASLRHAFYGRREDLAQCSFGGQQRQAALTSQRHRFDQDNTLRQHHHRRPPLQTYLAHGRGSRCVGKLPFTLLSRRPARSAYHRVQPLRSKLSV